MRAAKPLRMRNIELDQLQTVVGGANLFGSLFQSVFRKSAPAVAQKVEQVAPTVVPAVSSAVSRGRRILSDAEREAAVRLFGSEEAFFAKQAAFVDGIRARMHQ